ncbi:unnamed protein product, partial [Laminaria digitata]
ARATREGGAPPSEGATAAPAAGAPAPAAPVTADRGPPRAKTEAVFGAVSTHLEKLSSTYEQYATALARARCASTGSADDRRETGGSDGGGDPGRASGRGSAGSCRRSPVALRSDRARRDLADILDRTRKGLPLREAYGLEQLALAAAPIPPEPSTFSLNIPNLPELPARFVDRRAVAKRPAAAAA